jgi:cephalosporin-C deacetylase-like acetyl esterase
MIGIGSLFVLSASLALAGEKDGDRVKKNYWTVEGGKLEFASDDLTIRAQLPLGFDSLRIKGGEFIQGGKGYGGIAFRKPDGTFASTFTELTNVTHDQSRCGQLADGMFLLQIITGWTLPDFELYAGFNDTQPHDLVLFMADDVVALTIARLKQPISTAQQRVMRGAAMGTAFKATEIAAVHENGAALRIAATNGLSIGVVAAPDGQPRLAVVIPCKGMAANTIACRIEACNGADALTVFPKLTVESPTMGQGDPGYKPQSKGYWALYEKGAQVDYSVQFGWLGSKPFPGRFVVEARHALGQPHFRLEASPVKLSETNGVTQYRATIRPNFTLPGVSECNFFLQDESGVVLWADRMRFMYDWPAYQPTYSAPTDLKAFWDGTLAELAKVPLDPKIEETLFKDDPEWEFQHVSFNGWQGKRIHACVYIPKKAAKPLPVFIGAHPGTLGFGANHRADGVYGSQVKTDPRFVTIYPLIRGHLPDATGIPFNQPWWGSLDSRETHAAQAWFCAMVRALDYMATRPEIADMTRVVSSGGSQGGALALATAALDKRVKLCVADSPSNSMLSDSVRPGTYPSFGPTCGQVPPGQTLDDLLRTLSYFDPANLAPWIQCPTVIHLTVGDLTVHSMGGLGVFKNLTGLKDDQKWFFPCVNGHFHGGSAAGGAKAKELMQKLVEGK